MRITGIIYTSKDESIYFNECNYHIMKQACYRYLCQFKNNFVSIVMIFEHSFEIYYRFMNHLFDETEADEWKNQSG
jgi:hypothetical protein